MTLPCKEQLLDAVEAHVGCACARKNFQTPVKAWGTRNPGKYAVSLSDLSKKE